MFSVVGNLFLLDGITFISAAYKTEDCDDTNPIFCIFIGYMGEEKPISFSPTHKSSVAEIEEVRKAFIEKYLPAKDFSEEKVSRMKRIIFND